MPEKEKNIKLTIDEQTALNQILYYYLELLAQNIDMAAQNTGPSAEDIAHWGREVVVISQILEKIQKASTPGTTKKKTNTTANKK